MIVRFDCGCVGLTGVQGTAKGHALLIQTCDGEDSSLGLSPRDMSGKGLMPIPADQAQELVTELGRLIQQGYQLRTLRNLLRD